MKEEITRLTRLWYKVIGIDHHKDRDCHWYINTVYSYGQLPKFRVEHFGYIHDDVELETASYEEAERELAWVVRNALLKEREWAKAVKEKPDDWGEDQIERAGQIIVLTEPLVTTNPQ